MGWGKRSADADLTSFFFPLGGVGGCLMFLLLDSLVSLDGLVFVSPLRL